MKKNVIIFLLLLICFSFTGTGLSARARDKAPQSDREYWCETIYKIAAPILSNMSEGKLQERMQVEVSPTWDGRDIKVTYMEAFGRLMAGLAPWLALPDDYTAEGRMRKQLREWALKSYVNAVDPESPDYLLWRKEGQPLVDAALDACRKGGIVLFNPDWRYVEGIEGKFVPVFWSPVHFPTQAGTMGLLCDPSTLR